jgi:hypothetical protein
MNAIIKTFRPESKLSKHHFFIQSRGLHSGRPLTKSIPNCFSIELQSKQEQEKYFYLVQGLYQAKKFQFHLVGSVIPLIRIGDVKAVIHTGEAIMNSKSIDFEKTLRVCSTVDESIEQLHQKVELLSKLKQAYLHRLLLME